MKLERYEYIWSVAYTSRDDGHRLTAAWFTDRDEAESFLQRQIYGDDQAVVQTVLWRDSLGDYYEVERRKIPVDEHVLRRDALNKLSPRERRALGLAS